MNYTVMYNQLRELMQDIPHPIANMANAAALLWHGLDRINWAGFYLLEGGCLVLGPFQGKPACTEIPIAYANTGLDPQMGISSLEALADGCIRELYKK